ncbi:MAG: hypothetical protein RLZZ618_2311 [Pseudomonadota bacterium]|jgi:hypothetical protein
MTLAPACVPLLAYPPQASFGRTLPKNKVYEHSGAKASVREMFVRQVEQIVWQYKLAPETINLPAKPGAPEIQVFAIQQKTPELNFDVLRCLDGAVQFPTLFELTFKGRTQMVAAYKRPNQADASRWMLSNYFASSWVLCDAQRSPMPLALDLGGLYEQLLQSLLPLAARRDEGLPELVCRVEQAASKQREIEKVAGKLAKEKQFNRKVEINAGLRKLNTEYEQLIRET